MRFFLGVLCVAAFCAENNPFIGQWNFDPAASKFEPSYEVIEALGANRFRISEGPIRNPSVNTFAADGSDDPANHGRTIAVTPQGDKAWRVLWKMKNGARDEAVWSVTPDGRGLSMVGSYRDSDGTVYPINKTYERIAGTNGLAGKWKLPDSQAVPDAFKKLELRRLEGEGVSVVLASGKVWQSYKLDGRDYPDASTPKAVVSSIRMDPNTFKVTSKLDGNIDERSTFSVSTDRTTLKITDQTASGETTDVIVFKRAVSSSSQSAK